MLDNYMLLVDDIDMDQTPVKVLERRCRKHIAVFGQ